MAGRIPDETLQLIRDRTSLVEVVSSYVQLRKAGRNYVGLCPFHGEKTPSFTVNEERGFFHCFGCGAGGTVFTFLMRIERIDFPEAVEQLAKRAGVELPRGPSRGGDHSLQERLFEVNARAQEFFRRGLRGSGAAHARRYLSDRGLKEETIERFGLGFSPPGGNALVKWFEGRRVPLELAVRVGLLVRRQDGGVYDRFRGRLIFPIRDRRERVVAFGARTLGDEHPKYLNSPESPVFRKGEGLYGLAEAREAIRRRERVVLVEGYTDVILLAQEGIEYSAAVLGTALTVSQLRLLRPFGGERLNVFFLFDGDDAGRRAALRAFPLCVEADVWGRAVFLPAGSDPDSYVREHGGAAMLDRIEKAVPLADFYFDSIAPAGASVPERAAAARDVAGVLSRARSEVRFQLLARQAAQHLGVGEDVFHRARRGGRTAAAVSPPASPGEKKERWPSAEILLLETMVGNPGVVRMVRERGALASFSNTTLAAVGECLASVLEQNGDVGGVIDELPEELAGRLASGVFEEERTGDVDGKAVARDCIVRIEREARRRRLRRLAAELRQAEASGDDTASVERLADLNELLRGERGTL